MSDELCSPEKTFLSSPSLKCLADRGFVHQCTDVSELDQTLQKSSIAAYVGFDCTAPSLHIGHLLPIMMLRWLQKFGHRPIVVIGSGTTRIGDPTGKDTARPFLTDEEIERNSREIERVFYKFLDFSDGDNGAVIVDNFSWLRKLGLVEVLTRYGARFPMSQMLSKDSVQLRLQRSHEMSLLEFNYQVLQAIDFSHLYETYGCILQMGGGDQWGNIVSGVELIRRYNGAKVFGLTCPLIKRADGAKMGKSESGAVWLSEQLLDDADYHRYWLGTPEPDLRKFMLLFTDAPEDVIDKQIDKGPVKAREFLAQEATRLCRG